MGPLWYSFLHDSSTHLSSQKMPSIFEHGDHFTLLANIKIHFCLAVAVLMVMDRFSTLLNTVEQLGIDSNTFYLIFSAKVLHFGHST